MDLEKNATPSDQPVSQASATDPVIAASEPPAAPEAEASMTEASIIETPAAEAATTTFAEIASTSAEQETPTVASPAPVEAVSAPVEQEIAAATSSADSAPAEVAVAEIMTEAEPKPEPITAIVPFKRPSDAPRVELPPREETTEAAETPSRTVRFGLLAASIALVAGVGAAIGGVGMSRMMQPAAPPQVEAQRAPAVADETKALKAAIAELRGSVRALSDNVASLRGQIESAGKGTQAQFSKVSEGLQRLERAQAEPAARVARLADAVERLEKRATPAAATNAAAPETTASVRPQPAMGALRPPPPLPPLGADARSVKPVIDGWTLREVHQGVALVQGRYGTYEVIVGDDLRGAGRVQDIRRQDGQWIVITSRGVILAR